MIKKQKIYNSCICLALISFSFFGSLSHIFSLALIILTYFSQRITIYKRQMSHKDKAMFWSLSGCFFLFFFFSILRADFASFLHSMSPMLPLPLIGTLIILHSKTDLRLSAKNIALFSQVSIFFLLIAYLLSSKLIGIQVIYHDFHASRLMLFSGNPIPFSYAVIGISVFCLADWQNSGNKSRIPAFLLFLTGAYFAGFLSGTRGTLLSLLIISPIIVFYLTNNFKLSVIFIATLALTGILLIQTNFMNFSEISYIRRVKNGLDTIIFLKNNDSSVYQRLEMWSAALKAIFDAPIIGYGVVDRFSALKPHLQSSKFEYTHPHNDILASLISGGVTGGIASVLSLMSTLLAALFAPQRSIEKFLLGLMIGLTTLITASVSTVFF